MRLTGVIKKLDRGFRGHPALATAVLKALDRLLGREARQHHIPGGHANPAGKPAGAYGSLAPIGSAWRPAT
jgi:hypothetical protein